MAIIEFVLLAIPHDVGVYNVVRSIINKSIMQLKKHVVEGTALVKWDTENFPLTLERDQHYQQIKLSIEKLGSCRCEHQLFYRITLDDDAEPISLEQLFNLLESDLNYERQERD